MQALLQPLSKLGEYEEIKNRIEKNRGILQLAGCIDSQKAHVIYGLGQEKKNRLVIAENELKAKELYEDLKFYYPAYKTADAGNCSTFGEKECDGGDKHQWLYGLSSSDFRT